jgi:hypothetical protein
LLLYLFDYNWLFFFRSLLIVYSFVNPQSFFPRIRLITARVVTFKGLLVGELMGMEVAFSYKITITLATFKRPLILFLLLINYNGFCCCWVYGFKTVPLFFRFLEHLLLSLLLFFLLRHGVCHQEVGLDRGYEGREEIGGWSGFLGGRWGRLFLRLFNWSLFSRLRLGGVLSSWEDVLHIVLTFLYLNSLLYHFLFLRCF